MGAGNSVTALYEVVPAGLGAPARKVDALKYQKPGPVTALAESGELFTIQLRYKEPMGLKSELLTFNVRDDKRKIGQTSDDFRFSAAVAAFGMLLRGTEHKGSATFDMVDALAVNALGRDDRGYRAEFLELVQKARTLH
jgi:Ca-activated chloride channel family protein